MDKDTKKLIKQLREQGFEIRETRAGHIAVYKGSQHVITLASTSVSRVGMRNARAAIRRHGGHV